LVVADLSTMGPGVWVPAFAGTTYNRLSLSQSSLPAKLPLRFGLGAFGGKSRSVPLPQCGNPHPMRTLMNVAGTKLAVIGCASPGTSHSRAFFIGLIHEYIAIGAQFGVEPRRRCRGADARQ
jgi:hypothetical protein